MKITKLGHCCLLININGTFFLTDPGNYTTTQNDIKGIDFVVITHEHTDHLHIESLKLVLLNNPNAQVICNASVGKKLQEQSVLFTKIAHGEKMKAHDVLIEGYGEKHAPIYRDYEQVENTGYLFAHTFFYPGDTFFNPEVPIDILALPITAPWSKISESIDYALLIKPRIVFPVHDGNLLRQGGLSSRLPALFLEKEGVTFMTLDIGKETDIVHTYVTR